MKTLSDFDFKNKTVILRSDLNSDFKKGKILMSERIKESSKTISELKRKKAKVVILAHQGSPGKRGFVGLKQHAKLLNKFVKVKFLPDLIGKKAEVAIKNLKLGKAILLENVRFEKSEFKPDDKKNKLIKKLVPLADIYINDSFSVCHRKQTSIVSFPKYLPSGIGRLLEKELNALKKIKIKNCLYILGGAKPEDNIKLLKGNKVLACGIFGQLCIMAKGRKLGKNNDKEIMEFQKDYKEIFKKLKTKLENVLVPVDYAVEINSKRIEFPLEDFPTDYVIYDIGKKTQKLFVNEIKKAKAIYMKGPAGFCADKKFCKGTKEILKAIANSKAFSLIGGGHLSDAIEKIGINKRKFSHISLSGGALLNYVAGEKLPGLEALK